MRERKKREREKERAHVIKKTMFPHLLMSGAPWTGVTA